MTDKVRRFVIKDDNGTVVHRLTVPADAPEHLIAESLQRLKDALVPRVHVADLYVNDVPCVICVECPGGKTVIPVKDLQAHVDQHDRTRSS